MDSIEVEVQEAFMQCSEAASRPGCHDHVKLSKHLPAAGVKRCDLQKNWLYAGIHPSDDRWTRQLTPKRTRKPREATRKEGKRRRHSEKSVELNGRGGQDSLSLAQDQLLVSCSSPGNSLIVTPLTLAHLAIPTPESDEIYVIVPPNFELLTAPPPPPPPLLLLLLSFPLSLYVTFNPTVYTAFPQLPSPSFTSSTSTPTLSTDTLIP